MLRPFAPGYDAGVEAADWVISARVSAVSAFDDQMALGVLSRMFDRGVDVPGSISLIGCDDVLPVGVTRPSLTTVSAPCARVGRAAIEVILGGAVDTRQQSFEGYLVVCGSTGLRHRTAAASCRPSRLDALVDAGLTLTPRQPSTLVAGASSQMTGTASPGRQ